MNPLASLREVPLHRFVPEKKFLGHFTKRATVIVGMDGNVKYVAEHKEARKNDDILKELAKLS